MGSVAGFGVSAEAPLFHGIFVRSPKRPHAINMGILLTMVSGMPLLLGLRPKA